MKPKFGLVLPIVKLNIGLRKELAESDDDLLAYCNDLNALKRKINSRFTDLLEKEIPDWIIDPFYVHVEQFH